MPRRRRNNLTHLDQCFSNFINPFIHQSQLSPNNNSPPSSIVHHDLQINHNRPSSSTSIIKNFNTVYDNNTTEPEPEPESEPADFATAFASQRFFFSSPGRSNSIVESTPSSSSSSSLTSSLTTTAPAEASSASAGDESKAVMFEGSVAVPTYSPDPYLDFRQSMEEMVEARPELMADVKSNWHVLQELLMCYLALNPKSTHKFILGAFADLLVTRMAFSSSSSSASASCCCCCPPPENPEAYDGGGGEEC